MRAVVKPGKKSVMKKSLVYTAAGIAALMAVGVYFSASRIAACNGESRATAACMAEAWDGEKVNLLPQYDANRYVSDPTADSIFAATQPER